MPSDVNEPALEELSAYLDRELDNEAQARVAAHVAGCQACQTRLDGLRQTTYAVRALPMETPPRAFTIPAQRERTSRRWAPAAWLGGVAAAGLAIAIGVTQLGHLPPSAPSSAGTSMNYSDGSRTQKSTEHGAAAPVAAPAASALDRQFDSQSSSAPANPSTVGDPSNGSRRVVLATDRAVYSKNAPMRVTIQLQGSPSTSTDSGDQGLTLTLVRNGVGVALRPVGVMSWNGTPVFGGTYDLGSLSLAEPRAGDYRLETTWVIPDGSGRVLQASVPVRITG
jgi:anti-sigma factor RsiW